MNAACLFSKLKQKSHLLLYVSGIVSLILAVGFITFLSNENDKRYNALLKHMETMSEQKIAMKRDLHTEKKSHKRLNTKLRKKRETVEREVSQGAKTGSKGGAVYIRWGRTTCPDNNTELVYNGVGAGSWYDHTGAATNFQCLPNKPVWGRYTSGSGSAFIYGMEYQEEFGDIMDMSKVQSSLVDHNVLCAVCRSSVRTSYLMIPAMNICVKGWHLEYHGYLMAGHYGSKSGTQYVCVDNSPEADPAGYRDEDGVWLYRVTAQCGSLPCPRYESNREITCAVCTK